MKPEKQAGAQDAQAGSRAANGSVFRVKFHTIGCMGTVFYRIQMRKWWGWSTIQGWLNKQEVEKAMEQLSPKTPNDRTEPRGPVARNNQKPYEQT